MEFTIYSAQEQQLIQACRRGDAVAQRQLYDRYASRMYGICLRYVKCSVQAEDVLVMAFTRVFDKLSQFKGEGSLEGWIRRITINEALGCLRKRRAMSVETDLGDAGSLPDYHSLSDHLEEQDLLNMIGQLPSGYRIVFNLYAIDGYSHQEIAMQLGISENTSKSQLSRARTFLQKLLGEAEWRPVQKISNHERTT